MYEIKIESRGPEGVRGFKQFRITKEGSDQLQTRMEKKDVSMSDLISGIPLKTEEEDASQQLKEKSAVGGAAKKLKP